MSLQTWKSNGWLRPYRTSPAQIAELEHTTARLAEALQHEIVRAKLETAGATA